MARSALRPARSVAKLLREKRAERGLTLREVSERIGETGETLPPSTLARIEHGKLEPGVRRLHLLLRLYDIDAEQVADLVEFETGGVALPDHGDLSRLIEDSSRLWEEGRSKEAIANWLALMECEPTDEHSRYLRQRAALGFAYAMRNRSRVGVARRIVDRLLCEELSPRVKWMVFHLAASLWHDAAASEMAQVLAAHAMTAVRPGDHDAYATLVQQQAVFALDAGDLDEADEKMVHALRHSEAAGRPTMVARGQLFCGRIAMHRGEHERARDCFLRALELVDEHGFEMGRRSALVQLGWALTELGDFSTAMERLREARAAAVAADDRSSEFDALYRIWKLHLAAGEPAAARMAREQARLLADCVEEHSPEVEEVLSDS